jgi:cytochrome P450
MLPPGPREPSALQTVEWIVRPTALLRRAHARYGEPFTLRTAWMDAPLVLTSDPAEIKRVYAAPTDILEGGDGSAFLEPFVGPHSILILRGEEHLRRRKAMLPPFHGEALKRWAGTISTIAHEELDTWVPGQPLRALPRMQAVTLEVIQRVIFGSRDPELRAAVRAALDLTASTWRLVTMSLLGPSRTFTRAVERLDALVYERIDTAGGGDAIVDMLTGTREERRDQLVTLLAAGHETTATALAWALERLARHPTPLGDDAQIDAFISHVLRIRPVLSITARRVLQPYPLGGYTLPPGVYVAPCIYLAQDMNIQFGGGVRRCLGAAFATLEMREVLRAVASRFTLRPVRPEGERMRRRSVTLAPARGAEVIPDALA